jgi:UDP-GlcNAc3NAcA epimerase
MACSLRVIQGFPEWRKTAKSAHMQRYQITTIVGARPQFVKAAAMSRAFAEDARIEERLIHTGQHFDYAMSESFFRDLGLPDPAVNLGIGGLSHGAMTGRMIEAIEADLVAHRPDGVLIYGDTNSTLAGALAAVKLRIPVVHLEAGMRSGRPDAPEEINRIVTDHVSALLLCASHKALGNLEREGLSEKAEIVGDVMYDVTLFAKGRVSAAEAAARLGLQPGSYVLLTLHRAENTGSAPRLKQLLDFARSQSKDRPVVFPIHPRTEEAVRALGVSLDGFRLLPPLGYFEFHGLLSGAAEIMTDSGGIQKEAYFHRVPCTTLRDETEWSETLDAGWNRLWNRPVYAVPRRDIPDYGVGHAAEASVEAIASMLGA